MYSSSLDWLLKLTQCSSRTDLLWQPVIALLSAIVQVTLVYRRALK
jgi:hypothetical protein